MYIFNGSGFVLIKGKSERSHSAHGSAKSFHLGENDIVSSTIRERKGVC